MPSSTAAHHLQAGSAGRTTKRTTATQSNEKQLNF